MKRETAKKCLWILVAVVLAASIDTTAAERAPRDKVKITISRETTYIDGPVNPDGTINYVAALNAFLSKGVTRDNNAAVVLLQALGSGFSETPKPVATRLGRVTTRLEMPPLPEEGDYFVRLDQYVQEEAEPAAEQPDWERIQERVEQCRKQLGQATKAPWSAEQYPVIAAWLRANEKPLAMVVTATKLPRYYAPLISDSDPPLVFDMFFPLLHSPRQAALALAARAMVQLAAGDIDKARVDLLAVHRLARLVGQEGTVIHRLIGAAMETAACHGDYALAGSGRLSARQLKAHLADLQALPPLRPMWEAVDRAERFYVLDAVMICARTGVAKAMRQLADFGVSSELPEVDDVPVDWDVILRTFNSWYTRAVTAQRKPNANQRQAADRAMVREMEELSQWRENRFGQEMKDLLAGDPVQGDKRLARISQTVGKALLVLFASQLGRATEIHEEIVMRGELAELALALAAHRSEHGVYPAQLADLAPAYVKTVPNDRFSDEPLRYAPTAGGRAAYVLYSVGKNLKDDGGKRVEAGEHVGDAGEHADDIVVNVR